MLFYNPPLQPLWLCLGSPMFMDPNLSQQHAGVQHTAFEPQQEVTATESS